MARTRITKFASAPVLVVCVALLVPGNARAQCQVDKVTASAGNANAGDHYGWSVAVNGNYAVVGADVGDGGGSTPQADTGAAFLLQRDGLNWVEIQRLVANDNLASTLQAFGASVAISNNAELIVVGATKATGINSVPGAGAVYVFKRYQDGFPCAANQDCADVGLTTCTANVCEDLTWAIETILRADDPKTGDDFGFSVDIRGDVVVVGAWRTDNEFLPPSPGDAGAAYVYRRYQDSFPCQSVVDCQQVGLGVCVFEQGACEGITWIQEQKLTASNQVEQAFFGNSVSTDGNRIVVGAESVFGPGGAYIFEHNGTQWVEVQKLAATDGLDFDAFGHAVDLNGDALVVTAMNADPGSVSNAGKTYVYRQSGGTYGDECILTASNPATSDRFGRSASLHGDNLLIGARDTDVPASRAGSTYLFSFDGTDWNEIEEIRAADGEGGDRFGHAVSLSDTYGIVGAYREDDAGLDAGAAYVLAIGLGRDCNANLVPDDCEVIAGTEPDLNGNGTPDACDCQSDDDCGGGSDACSMTICNQDSQCELAIDAGMCRIEGVCYADGAANPANECRVCRASADQEGFTPLANSTPCADDSNGCTLDVCIFGFCIHRPTGPACQDDGNPCTISESHTCDAEGNCIVVNLPKGTICPIGGGPCTDDVCDGAGNCGATGLPKGTICPDDGEPCTIDVCDGAGICEHLRDDTQVCPGFVKSHQKISDTDGGFTGEFTYRDEFGSAVASLGDLDGDGVGDVAVGEPKDYGGGINRGAVWVLFLNADGTVKSHKKISVSEGGFTGQLDHDDSFGTSVAALPDLDGDGVVELAVGASGDDDGGTDRGAVWVLFLKADGTVKSQQKISDFEGGFTATLDDSDSFGTSVAALPDLDGDGVGDLAVGAVGDDDGGDQRGAVWVLFLNSTGTVRSYRKISDTQGGFTGSLSYGDFFGSSIVSHGDMDGDGVAELVVGAEGDDDDGGDRGAVWVLFLNTEGAVESNQKISATQGGFTGTLDYRYNFGGSVASPGDLDGDGVGDLVVGTWGDDDGGESRGAVWVLFLNNDGTVKSNRKISDIQGGFTGVLGNSDVFGYSVASLGDLDGDGVSELAVGAIGDDDGGLNNGAVWVLFLDGVPGECFGAEADSPCADDGNPCTDNVCDGAGGCGVSLPEGTICPDDGNPCKNNICHGEGRCGVNLPEGTACPDDGNPSTVDECNGAGTCKHASPGTVKGQQRIGNTDGGFTGELAGGDSFGRSVASLGDLDGDGVGDLAVSATGDDDGGSASGAVWILFLNGDGTVKALQKISSTEGNFTGTLDYDDRFGSSLASLGDLDGDGVGDLVVGAFHGNGGGDAPGAVWVLFLNADGTVKAHQRISDAEGGFTGTLADDGFFGSYATFLGDLDGDGVGELAVTGSGSVWVLFLNTDGTVKGHQEITGFIGPLAGIGDLDGDGVRDLAVGAFHDDDGGTNHGAVWILFLNIDGTVKSQQKISDTQGGFTGVLNDDDSFGSSVAWLGDVDGDGVGELAVGAIFDDVPGVNRGAVRVLFLNTDGTVKGHQKIGDSQGGFTGVLQDNDYFNSVASLGDVDGDGVRDLAVGAYRYDDDGYPFNRGAVWVLFLEGEPECVKAAAGTPCTDDSNPCTANVCDGVGNCGVNSPEGTACPDDGNSCTDNDCDGAGTCNVNLPAGTFCTDDGNPCTDNLCDGVGNCETHDLLAGAVCTEDGNLCTDDVCDGAGICEHIDDGTKLCPGTVESHQKISDTEGGFTGTLVDNDWFGSSVALLEDLDGDGVSELAVGASGERFGLEDARGAVWVLFPNSDGSVKLHQKISDSEGGFIGTLDDRDQFGVSVASLGDVNGDGVGDLAVGASGDDDGSSDRGAVWVLFLNADGTVKSHQKISETEGGFTGSLTDGDLFGSSIASLGDLNGDGVIDLAVGANKDNDGGIRLGAVWVLFLNTNGTVKSHQKISAAQGGFVGTLDADDWFGSSLASLGDLDGDGVVDLAVGALLDDDGGDARGAVWVLFLNTDGTVKSQQKISSTQGGFTGLLDDRELFGFSVTSLGDLNGDGVADLAVGASRDNDGGTWHGAVWVLFLNTDGTVKSHQKISDTQGRLAGTLDISDQFGYSMASLGDMNGDGIFDLAVGAVGDDDGGSRRGAVWLLQLAGIPGACFQAADGADCDDGRFCNGLEECIDGACRSSGNPCRSTALPHCDNERGDCFLCREDADCDDRNLCTIDRCEQSACVYLSQPKGESCGDPSASPCDRPDFCDGLGSCLDSPEPDGTLCPDALFCNGKESCMDGVCQASTNPCLGSEFAVCSESGDRCLACTTNSHCDDQIDCTEDVCVLGQCIHPLFPVDTPCGDQQTTPCHQPDTCDGFGVCIDNSGADGFDCDDGLFCNGAGTCLGGVCIQPGDICAEAGLFCDEFAKRCFDSSVSVIYNNTIGQEIWRPRPTGIRIADEIVTNAVTDCPISEVTIRVNGGIPGGGGQFKVQTELWDGCPNLPSSSTISGTDLLFEGLDDNDAIDHDLQLIPPGGPMTLPPTFWIQVSFNTRASGWVFGTPATTGFSGDWYNHPFTACNTWFGGWPNLPHASGYVVVRAERPCATVYPAYRAVSPTAPAYFPPAGEHSRVADDLQLIADDCVLGAYELAIRGLAGPYEMSMDLRVEPEGNPIAGTQHVFEGRGEGSIEVVRFTVPPEIEIQIPQNVWMTWQASKPSTGVLNVGRTQIGQSEPTFAGMNVTGNPDWTLSLLLSDRDAIFHVTIYCRGQAPRGACCPAQDPDAAVIACQDDLTALSCAAPDPSCGVIIDCPDARWAIDSCCGNECCVGGTSHNQTCADNADCPGGSCVTPEDPPAFDPPCGAFACTTLLANAPSDCAIDARQPSTVDGLTAQGWDAMDVTVGPSGCASALSKFSVNSSPKGRAPLVSSVSQVGDMATITFDAVIPLRNWTCVSLTTDAAQQVCLGNLPGDVNSDGTSNPALDIAAMIDCINNPGTCADWQENIDRTGGVAGVLDITRLIDLFNGVGAYPSFTGASLGGEACPSE